MIDPDYLIRLTLTAAEVEIVLAALGEVPPSYAVAAVIGKIRRRLAAEVPAMFIHPPPDARRK